MIRQVLRITLLAGLAACGGEQPLPLSTECHAGGYRLEDGRVMGLVARDPGDIRYLFMSGDTGGILEQDDGVWRDEDGGALLITLGDCGDDRVVFDPGDAPVVGERIAYTVTETVFDGVDGKRAGRLTLPSEGPVDAIAVALHGSERWSGRTGGRFQSILPAFGIGVFTFDKRGTGESEGAYTQDLYLLAEDATLARKEAARLYGATVGEVDIGYLGPSQGGWVAPLAASMDGAAFVIASFGLAISPSREDQQEVFLALRAKGYGEDVIEKAREVTDATRAVLLSDFRSGYKQLNAVRKAYKNEDWYDDIEGEYSGQLLSAPNIGLRIVGPWRTVDGTPEYEPRPVLEGLAVPQLWILAEKDRAAPTQSTLDVLLEVQETNQGLDVVVFPDTDHGMVEFIEADDGSREYTKVTDGYYALVRDYILTREPTLGREGPTLYRGGAGPAPLND
ncbi:MAG: alpha/beta hydrolase [Pseudomonadota bacterium]